MVKTWESENLCGDSGSGRCNWRDFRRIPRHPTKDLFVQIQQNRFCCHLQNLKFWWSGKHSLFKACRSVIVVLLSGVRFLHESVSSIWAQWIEETSARPQFFVNFFFEKAVCLHDNCSSFRLHFSKKYFCLKRTVLVVPYQHHVHWVLTCFSFTILSCPARPFHFDYQRQLWVAFWSTNNGVSMSVWCLRRDGPLRKVVSKWLTLSSDIGLWWNGNYSWRECFLLSAEFCANVTCEEVESLMLECPGDSIPLPPIVTHNGCCSKHQGWVQESVSVYEKKKEMPLRWEKTPQVSLSQTFTKSTRRRALQPFSR